jgi:ribosomal protein L4
MATLKTVDAGNKAAGKIEIDDTILETPYHKKAVSEVVRQFLAANQQGTHSTKTRGEVAYSVNLRLRLAYLKTLTVLHYSLEVKRRLL